MTPKPEIRIVKYNGDYGSIPGILGNKPVEVDGELKFPVNSLFHISEEPDSAVHPFIKAPAEWRPGKRRLLEPNLNFVNIGDGAIDFGNAFNFPFRYVYVGGWTVGIKDLFRLSFSKEEKLLATKYIHGTVWDQQPAIEGLPKITKFYPFHQGLNPGFASVILEPRLSGYTADISDIPDGEYNLSISSILGIFITITKIKLEALEMKVIGL